MLYYVKNEFIHNDPKLLSVIEETHDANNVLMIREITWLSTSFLSTEL